MKIKSVLSFLFLATAAYSCGGAELACTNAVDAGTLRVGSYNIRNERHKDDAGTENEWSKRKTDLLELVKKLDYDIFGLQEVLPGQADFLKENLPGYAMAGVHRDDGARAGEASPVFYKKDRFEVLKSGTFWLSEKPDTPGSQSWGSSKPRICTWAYLKDLRSGKKFLFANTHTDHRSKEAKIKGTRLILKRMRRLVPRGTPIVFTGDHNCRETDKPAREISKTLKSALFISKTPVIGPWRTFNGWAWRDKEFSAVEAFKLAPEARNSREGSPDAEKNSDGTHQWEACGARIDYIYVSDGITVESYETVSEPRPGTKLYPSDHFPLVADIRLP